MVDVPVSVSEPSVECVAAIVRFVQEGVEVRYQSALDRFVQYREGDLHTPEEIPVHPVGAGAENAFLAVAVEIIEIVQERCKGEQEWKQQ